MLHYNKNLRPFARDLRKNMTDAERLLWSKIQGKQLWGLQFYRQKTIDNFIVDFYCPRADLVIDVDGGQHYTEDGLEKDKSRDQYLNAIGLRVMRFNNLDVLKNIEGVISMLDVHLKSKFEE